MKYAWIDLGDGRQVYRKIEERAVAKSHLPSPMIRSDVMELTQHPVDGQMYDSKSTFSRITRQNGFVEIGNDPSRLKPAPRPLPDREGIRQSLKKAAAKLSA